MKTTRFIKKITAALAVTFTAMILASATVHAIPYTGDTTVPSSYPAFNVFTGVSAPWGDENDFFRARVDDGSQTDYSDPLTNSCTNGTKFQLRVYVHNGAGVDGNLNGTGPSVAHGTRVKVDLKNSNEQTIFSPNATISATNAATVSDVTTINCNGRTVKLHYIQNSATQYSKSTGVLALSDDIVSNGVSITSHNVPGDVWGCWDERVYVVLSVQVEEVTKPVPPVVSTAICVVDDKAFVVSDVRKVTITVDAKTVNATKTGKFEINWGDGSTVSTNQTDTHVYAKDGTYTITGRVQVKMADGTVKWVDGGTCTRQVTFKPGETPVVPVTPVTPVVPPATVLPNTGAGNVFGIFTAVSIAGAFMHKVYLARKATRI